MQPEGLILVVAVGLDVCLQPAGPIGRKIFNNNYTGMHMSDALFSSLVAAPADPILGVTQRYRQDPRPQKVNLGVRCV